MIDYPRVRIGHFNKVAVWALYYRPDPLDAESGDLAAWLVHQPEVTVVWLLDESACYCGKCERRTSIAPCPHAEVLARRQRRREQERRPENVIEIERFEMPAYFTVGGRIREIVNQLTERRNSGGS